MGVVVGENVVTALMCVLVMLTFFPGSSASGLLLALCSLSEYTFNDTALLWSIQNAAALPGTWRRTDVHLENPEYHTRWYFKYFLGQGNYVIEVTGGRNVQTCIISNTA